MIPVIALFSFSLSLHLVLKEPSVRLKMPAMLWAITGNDSTKVTPLQGVFQINDLKAGTYKIVVEGKAPYKDLVKEGVVLKDGEVLDLGKFNF